MTVAITEVDAFTTPVLAPQLADPRSPTVALAGLQPLANRTKNLNSRLSIREQFAIFSISGTGLALGGFATLAKLDNGVWDDGYTLTDSNRRIVPPAVPGLYRISIRALILLNSALTGDSPYLQLRSNTAGALASTSRAHGGNNPIVADRQFVHSMTTISPGDVWVEFGTEASTVRTATINAGSLTIERLA
jgi:hypothetical protein